MQKIGMQKVGRFVHPLLDIKSPLAEHVIYKKSMLEYKESIV
jgi:hypothetical protein